MSDFVPHKKSLERTTPLRILRVEPQEVQFKPNAKANLKLAGGKDALGTCLGCHDAPCIELDSGRMELSGDLSAFPGDPLLDVCPTNAIDWNDTGDLIQINADQCIGCGLCAHRCPYGAISLTSKGHATVESGDPDGITEPTHETVIEASHIKLVKSGSLGDASSPFLKKLPGVLARLNDVQSTRLTRNLFLSLGLGAQMHRKGDTNVRMDGVLEFSNGTIGVVELETSQAVLESPRALLEDVAVLHNRFGVPKESIVPVSVIGAFPNVRVEYYQVMDDIEKVLGIQCHTITLGALCVLSWHFQEIDEFGNGQFITAQGATDLFPSMRSLIDDLANEEPYSGAFRPAK
ncbi:4Fe-4S dicluster domain-containing protein [Ruegeria arenilitoris]|uniref:4Fe-4S dicluster domain-containing protein n=1 Tax=Ruegeria arenilitoris TaxID=1173585 RepID=UPI00266FB9FE|nr:4Fe-4S dicluster domain-containing protein [Ruegeria arenilitoris]